MMNAIVLYSLVIVLVIVSLFKSRLKTINALKKSLGMFLNLLPEVLAVMLFVGLSLAIMSPKFISSAIGNNSGVIGIIVSIAIGSVAMLPSFIVFPLGATLVENGGGLPQIGALMTALMSVGLVSIPVESKMFGKKFAILRNIAGIVLAILFSLIVLGLNL